jgi:hypothetical protein
MWVEALQWADPAFKEPYQMPIRLLQKFILIGSNPEDITFKGRRRRG